MIDPWEELVQQKEERLFEWQGQRRLAVAGSSPHLGQAPTSSRRGREPGSFGRYRLAAIDLKTELLRRGQVPARPLLPYCPRPASRLVGNFSTRLQLRQYLAFSAAV